mmetsp:Transcript_9648/g.13659  ORF Transcript_9648/g.13659 Transcript_9648/m.13659 type:complete len:142 (-) Transcript_9648:514-939(-)
MASPDLQARAQALNSKMEGAAKLAIDEIEKTLIRPLAKLSYKCVVECYEKAGSTQPSEQLDHCAKQCQAPYQLSHNIIQQEVNSFQDRLSRSMMQCNDEASANITPEVQKDARKMKKVGTNLNISESQFYLFLVMKLATNS